MSSTDANGADEQADTQTAEVEDSNFKGAFGVVTVLFLVGLALILVGTYCYFQRRSREEMERAAQAQGVSVAQLQERNRQLELLRDPMNAMHIRGAPQQGTRSVLPPVDGADVAVTVPGSPPGAAANTNRNMCGGVAGVSAGVGAVVVVGNPVVFGGSRGAPT